MARTTVAEERVTFAAAGEATLICRPPFPPIAGTGAHAGFVPGPLVDHALAERHVGVLIVRLGAHAVGIFEGDRLVASKVDRRLVHGRHRAGGQSARRFERRRAGQARQSLEAAADLTARILVPEAARLDAFVTGGDRSAIADVLKDVRLAPLVAKLDARVLDVPEPRLEVLRRTPEAFRATRVELREGPP